MSTRTLLEFNGDYASKISDHPLPFVAALRDFLHNPSSQAAQEGLAWFGVRTFGERHSDSPFEIQYGYTHHYKKEAYRG